MSIVWAVDNGGSDGARSVRGLIFFLLVLSLFWTILTVKGWVHTSVAGVCATWYFLSPHAVPANPVLHAVRRASTSSFGSICFGAFIVAFIRTVRFFVNMAYQNARNSNNQLAACALCCLECLIGLLESIVNYVACDQRGRDSSHQSGDDLRKRQHSADKRIVDDRIESARAHELPRVRCCGEEGLAVDGADGEAEQKNQREKSKGQRGEHSGGTATARVRGNARASPFGWRVCGRVMSCVRECFTDAYC